MHFEPTLLIIALTFVGFEIVFYIYHEGRIEQLNQPRVHQAPIHGLHRLLRPGRITGAADHRAVLRSD